MSAYFVEALLSQGQPACDPEVGLLGFFTPAADASDVAAEVLEGILNGVGG